METETEKKREKERRKFAFILTNNGFAKVLFHVHVAIPRWKKENDGRR